MSGSIERSISKVPGRSALIDGLSKSGSISFALVSMEGRLIAHNPEFAKAVGWSEVVDDLNDAGTPLGQKLADAARTAAWQGISVKTTWAEGGWSEFEILPAGEEGAIILGHLSVPRSCMVADQDRQVLYGTFFADNPLPMLVIEPRSRVILDANRSASELLGVRLDLLVSMVMDQTGLSDGKVLSSVPSGESKRASFLHSPRNPEEGPRRLEVMLDRVVMGEMEQIVVTVLDVVRTEDLPIR